MLPNKGVSPTKPGERYEPLWSPLMPEPEPWSEEKRQEMNSGTKKDTPTTEKLDKYLDG